MPKTPDIFCRKGNPLGELKLVCVDAFQQAATHAHAVHGPKAARVFEAAGHFIQGLEHLIETQGHDLAAAYKVVAKAVQTKHGLNASALQEVVRVASSHWPRGVELSELVLGRG